MRSHRGWRARHLERPGQARLVRCGVGPGQRQSRVGSVYTPPRQRGRGYGSAVTATVSQWALVNGATDVLLFADLANSTSNSIYQKLGYVRVLDAVEHRFN